MFYLWREVCWVKWLVASHASLHSPATLKHTHTQTESPSLGSTKRGSDLPSPASHVVEMNPGGCWTLALKRPTAGGSLTPAVTTTGVAADHFVLSHQQLMCPWGLDPATATMSRGYMLLG